MEVDAAKKNLYQAIKGLFPDSYQLDDSGIRSLEKHTLKCESLLPGIKLDTLLAAIAKHKKTYFLVNILRLPIGLLFFINFLRFFFSTRRLVKLKTRNNKNFCVIASYFEDKHALFWRKKLKDLNYIISYFGGGDEVIFEVFFNSLKENYYQFIANQYVGVENVVAFFYPTRSFRSIFADLPERLANQGYTVIRFYGGITNDSFEANLHSYLIVDDYISTLSFVKVFFIPCIMNCLPVNSIKVLIDHLSFAVFSPDKSGQDTVQEAYTHALAYLPLMDYVITPSKMIMNQLQRRLSFYRYAHKDEVPSAELSAQAADLIDALPAEAVRNNVVGIPGGYPKFDQLIRAAKDVKKEKIIVYAPTPNDHSGNKENWLPYMSINECGIDIVNRLCLSFPDYKIVFKPHADEFEEVVNGIVENNKHHANFYLDHSGSNYIDLYARTLLMVSDFSSTAYTYAFSMLSPVIFFSRNEEMLCDYQKNFGADDYCLMRTMAGFVVQTLDDMVEKIQMILQDPKQYSADIKSIRDQFFYHFGDSVKYIVDNFEDIISKKDRDDWYVGRRLPLESLSSELV